MGIFNMGARFKQTIGFGNIPFWNAYDSKMDLAVDIRKPLGDQHGDGGEDHRRKQQKYSGNHDF